MKSLSQNGIAINPVLRNLKYDMRWETHADGETGVGLGVGLGVVSAPSF